ncbi:unnamed protein product, partial [Gulo gulo]
LPQNEETQLPQPPSPGLAFRLGVLIRQRLDALLGHISQHREGWLHDEVDETCSKGGTRWRVPPTHTEGWAEVPVWLEPPSCGPSTKDPRPRTSLLHRKTGFKGWQLREAWPQPRKHPVPLPGLSSPRERPLTNLRLCHQSRSAITQ